MTATPADTPAAAAPPKWALLIVFLVVFIDLLGFGIVLPIMPRLAKTYMAGLSEQQQGLVIGLLYSSFSLMQFIFSPIWGRLSDRIGRKPILLMSLVGSVVFYGLFGFAVSLPASESMLAIGLMMLARIGAGIAGASVGTAAAVIADCTTRETRAKGMALIGIAFGGGFTLGPLIAYFGLTLFTDEPWIVGAIASGLSFIALLAAITQLPETRRPGVVAESRGFLNIHSTMDVLKTPFVGALILVYFLAIFAFGNFEATLALFTGTTFGLTDKDNFLVFAYIGCVLMFAGGIYRPLVKRRPAEMLLLLGVGFMLVGLAGFGGVAYAAYMLRESPDMVLGLKRLFYISITIAVAGFAFVNPSVSSLISKRTDASRQGEVMGVNQGVASLGRIMGPFAGSVLFAAHASHTLPYVAATLTLMAVIGLLQVPKKG